MEAERRPTPATCRRSSPRTCSPPRRRHRHRLGLAAARAVALIGSAAVAARRFPPAAPGRARRRTATAARIAAPELAVPGRSPGQSPASTQPAPAIRGPPALRPAIRSARPAAAVAAPPAQALGGGAHGRGNGHRSGAAPVRWPVPRRSARAAVAAAPSAGRRPRRPRHRVVRQPSRRHRAGEPAPVPVPAQAPPAAPSGSGGPGASGCPRRLGTLWSPAACSTSLLRVHALDVASGRASSRPGTSPGRCGGRRPDPRLRRAQPVRAGRGRRQRRWRTRSTAGVRGTGRRRTVVTGTRGGAPGVGRQPRQPALERGGAQTSSSRRTPAPPSTTGRLLPGRRGCTRWTRSPAPRCVVPGRRGRRGGFGANPARSSRTASLSDRRHPVLALDARTAPSAGISTRPRDVRAPRHVPGRGCPAAGLRHRPPRHGVRAGPRRRGPLAGGHRAAAVRRAGDRRAGAVHWARAARSTR